MNYKIEGAIKRNEKTAILFAILWLILTIVFIAPVSNGMIVANANGAFDSTEFLETFMESVQSPFGTIKNIIEQGQFMEYLKAVGIFSIIYFIIFIIGFIRTAPKNQFSDIEHGSSDWSQHGEQYKILSNKKGIILAENNYLPVDKRGNVNVLVVGRFRFW